MNPAQQPRIDILLATFNGEARLKQQLDSILNQTYPNWHILVRDDGSTDRTLDILSQFVVEHPNRMTIVQDSLGNLRTKANFAELLRISDAPYANFCDQDDIWDPDKLATAMSEMLKLEQQSGTAPKARMVVTDRRIVDEKGNEVAASYWEHSAAHPRYIKSFMNLLVLPIAAGSSTLVNADLRKLALPIPDSAIQYDCWIELVASAFGDLVYVPTQKLTYVRHSGNVSGGGRPYPAWHYWKRARWLIVNLSRQQKVYRRLIGQARTFLERYGTSLRSPEERRLKAFVGLEGAILPVKVWRALISKGLPPTPERGIVFLLLV